MYLIKFAYDGTKFNGFSMEKDSITVEGEINSVIKKFGIAERIYPSSRTDRNVSALGNVFGIKSDENIEKIFGILNSHIRNMVFYAYAKIDDNFKPRHARERWYRYYLLDKNFDLEEMNNKAKEFIGEHDFSGFSRDDGRNPIRKIQGINIFKENDFIIIDIRGESFLWNMVRRIIGFLAYGKGDPFKKGSRYKVPAENLILMDVSYDFKFNFIKPNKNFSRQYQEMKTMLYLYAQMSKIGEGRWGIEPQ